MSKARWCQIIAWTVAAIVCLLAIITWGNDWNWRFTPFSLYQIFPVLGLLAYSLMWSHYVAVFVRQRLDQPSEVLHIYFEITSVVVLALIALHPSLLVYQRFRDGFGLPPGSYESYVAPGLAWVTLLGSACWLTFMFYELRRWFAKRGWWHYTQLAVDLAMLGIFYHALRLGVQIHGWYRAVWWFYGLTLVLLLLQTYYVKYLKIDRANRRPGLTAK